MIYVVTILYLCAGLWAAKMVRSWYTDEREWYAVIPFVMLFWVFIAMALIVRWLFYEARTWWRWR